MTRLLLQDPDLGALLLGFLRKYGLEFQYDKMAISLEENDLSGEIPQVMQPCFLYKSLILSKFVAIHS